MAQAHLDHALEWARQTGDRRSEAFTLHRLGDLAAARGESFQEADARYSEALALRRAIGHEGVADTALALGRLRLAAGDEASARPLIEEARELAALHRVADVGALPDACLALLGVCDAASVAAHDRCPARTQVETHLVLHRAGGGAKHLEAARELLERMSSHLAGEDLASFWRRSPLARAYRAQAEAP
jgi:hypothetical protein